MKQATAKQSLEELINETLPSTFKGQFKLNTFSQGVLIMTCASAALMTKFRFSQDQFLSMLNARIHPQHVKQIKIKIRPTGLSRNEKAQQANTQKKLSKKNAQILLEEAEHTDDLRLKEVLSKLAQHGE
jgi:hypothetical protein